MQQVQISAKHKLVALPLDPRVVSLFPQAREVDLSGGKQLLVHHGATESFMLRRLGYDVPAPILSQYHWPAPESEPPFDAQKKTSALLTMNNRAYVLNGMGTGKTRAALWAWDYLRGNGMAQKLLVLAPLSTLKFTWQREVFAVLPEAKVEVLHGTKKQRLDRLANPEADIFVINHDGLKVILEEVQKRTDIDTLVIDELAVYRNLSDRSKKLQKFAALPHIKWVWGMTGSPTPNSPTDVWGQAKIVNPLLVPKFFTRFRDMLMTRVSEFKFVPKPDAVERAFSVLQPAVRFTLDEVYELPDTIERVVDVELGKNQARVYKEIAATCYAAVQNQEITAANAGAAMSKLLQISTGWVYTAKGIPDKAVVALDNGERIKALIDAVMATDRKCLIFVPFKHALAGISEALTAEDIEHAVVSGDTPANERAQVFSLFQNTDKYHAIAAHPQCLAHGITLTAADTMIWFAPVTSLEIYEQANARISRVGQKHKQLVLHLQSTPVEKRIYSLLRGKQKVQDQLLDLFSVSTQQGEG